MKQISTILNGLLAVVLVWMVVSIGRPILSAGAAQMPIGSASVLASEALEPDSETACGTGRSIQVSGTAVVNVVPDRILIQLGIQSNGLTPQRVEAENSATINRITRALKREGVVEKDIVTDWYVIQPVYNDYNSLVIDGYRINNVVAVTLRDIQAVNEVVIAALDAGANQVINVEFYLSDLRKYRDQARELAMQAAQEKAGDLARAAGSEAGCVLNINENTWSYYQGGWYGQSRELWTQNVTQNAAPAGGGSGALDGDGPLNLGQISVQAQVNASFSLK